MRRAFIEVYGADVVIDGLRSIDKRLASDLRHQMKTEAQPILQEAKQYALALGGSGDYAASMAMRTIKEGVRISANDEGAGVIEFANPGALARKGPRVGKPVGVPRGEPPRALIRAAIENEQTVVAHIESDIDEMIERYFHG